MAVGWARSVASSDADGGVPSSHMSVGVGVGPPCSAGDVGPQAKASIARTIRPKASAMMNDGEVLRRVVGIIDLPPSEIVQRDKRRPLATRPGAGKPSKAGTMDG